MKWPLFISLLLLILGSTLFIADGPDWLVCIVAVCGGWWASCLLDSDEEPDVEVFCIADWRAEEKDVS